MHLTTLLMSGLLGSALAMPRKDYAAYFKKKPHHHHSPSATAAPIGGYPYSLNATAAGPIATGGSHHGSGHGNGGHGGDEDVVIDVQVTSTAGGQEIAAAEVTPALPFIQAKQKVKPSECNAATVTVTSNSVTTVTVGAGEGSAESGESSEPTEGAISIASSPVETQPSKLKLTPSETSMEGGSPPTSSSAPAAAEETSAKKVAKPVPQAAAAKAPKPPSTDSTDTTDTTDKTGADTAGGDTAGSDATESGATGPSPAGKPAAGLRTKRGIIASGDAARADTLARILGNSKVSWLGNWYSGAPKTLADSITFVPQMYGKTSEEGGEWDRNAKKAIEEGAKYFFSFGEPGTPNEKRHMEPDEGAQFFMKEMQPYADQGVTIGAPGTLQNKQDFDWLEKFLAACTECSIGFLQQHWFDKAAPTARQVEAFKGTVNDALKIANGKYPVWVENIQAQGTEEEQIAFFKEVLPWLDSQDQIQGYGVVPCDTDNPGKNYAGFLDGGNLNSLGQLYATL